MWVLSSVSSHQCYCSNMAARAATGAMTIVTFMQEALEHSASEIMSARETPNVGPEQQIRQNHIPLGYPYFVAVRAERENMREWLSQRVPFRAFWGRHPTMTKTLKVVLEVHCFRWCQLC